MPKNAIEEKYLKMFGQRLANKRKEKKVSQEMLASRANLDRSYIGGIERGERNVSLINIIKIANALDISLTELFENF